MAVQRSYARLGLFMVVVLVVALATALFFIQRLRSRDTLALVTYTAQNVSGLDIGNAVRLKGVSVGRVTDVRVDTRANGLVMIRFDVLPDRLTDIGADVERAKQVAIKGGIFEQFRTLVVSNPVTGEAYLLLDKPANPPPPMALGFTPDRAYVPSMPSPLATIQDRMPDLLARGDAVLQTLNGIIEKIPDSLDRSNRFFTNVERILQDSELPASSAATREFLTTTTAQMTQLVTQVDSLVGSRGTLVSFMEDAHAAMKASDFPASAQATRDAAERSMLAADDLRRSLPAIRDSLEQLRELARLLEEQPESIVHGVRPTPENAK